MLNLKNIVAGIVLATGMFVSSQVSAQSAFDRYNAQLNTPAVKASLLRSVCNNANGVNLALCDNWTKNGVPNSDVRYAVVASGAVLGAGAGLATTVPFAALGGKTLAGQWGITSVLGWAPTTAVLAASGAVIGTSVAAGSLLVSR